MFTRNGHIQHPLTPFIASCSIGTAFNILLIVNQRTTCKIETNQILLAIHVITALVNGYGYSILNATIGLYYVCGTNTSEHTGLSERHCNALTDVTYLIAHLSLISSSLCISLILSNKWLKLTRLQSIRSSRIFLPWFVVHVVCFLHTHTSMYYLMEGSTNLRILFILGAVMPSCNIISFSLVYEQ